MISNSVRQLSVQSTRSWSINQTKREFLKSRSNTVALSCSYLDQRTVWILPGSEDSNQDSATKEVRLWSVQNCWTKWSDLPGNPKSSLFSADRRSNCRFSGRLVSLQTWIETLSGGQLLRKGFLRGHPISGTRERLRRSDYRQKSEPGPRDKHFFENTFLLGRYS